jgi:hypothetical protein
MPSKLFKTVLLWFFGTIISLFCFTFSFQTAMAAPFFSDDFNTNLDQWEINRSSPYAQITLSNGMVGSKITRGGTVVEIIPKDIYWGGLRKQYILSIDVFPILGSDKNVVFRTVPFVLTDYFEIHNSIVDGFINNKPNSPFPISLVKTDGNGFTFVNGNQYHVEVSVLDKKVIIVIKNLAQNTTFVDQTINLSSPLPSGKVGIKVGTGGDPTSEVWFDNISVTEIPSETATPTATPTDIPTATPTTTPTEDPTSTPTQTPTATPSPTPSPTPTPTPTLSPTPYPYPSLNVLDLKQYDSRWKSLIYDNAINWSSTPTIERWGCALTSASMVLNYYGFNALPDKLNTWLKNQPDGYLSNGLLNWLAISRYSKLFSSHTLPTLEFKRLGNIPSLLINELTNNRPSILEVPGHFVVAYSQTPTSFGINDPGYSNRPTLLSYSDTFKSIRSFTPSHTDLSYILLTIDQIFNLTVLDSKGNEINVNTYIDDPLVDDVDNLGTSGNPLKIFEFPKPANGEYTIIIQGNGEYTLTSYLYDKNGNVTKNITHKTIENGAKDIFKVSIGKKNSFNKEISLKQIFEDLNRFHGRKLITNYVYKDIKRELQTVDDLIHMHKYDLAERFLNLIKREIKILTPWAIKSEASKILIQDIEDLIKLF